MHNSTLRIFASFVLTIGIFGSLAAQTGEGLIVLDATVQRQVITAYAPDQTINFHHLKKGETYLFVVPTDLTLGDCIADVSSEITNAEVLEYNPDKHLLRFKALSTITQIKLHYPCSWDGANPPRHYISIACQSCGQKKDKENQADMATLEVEGAGADELIREVFIGGDCFDVMNVVYTGGGDQIGKFSNGLTNIGFGTGMIMATGDINVAPGPNDSNGAGGGGAGGGDGDLASIATGPMFDVAVIEFDFTPTQTPLTFEYAFASEEYCEYVSSGFNDVFGFFISGPGIAGTQNLAVVPLTTTPITINTINHMTNSGLYTANTPAGLDNCETGGVCNCLTPQTVATGQATQELQYDGFTRKMIAVANVIPCSTYHIKLAIADVSDGVWDSAVFLKAGSFDGGGNASIQWLVNGVEDVNEVVEGCGTVQIKIDRVGSNLFLPLPVSFTITGTATSGADYSAIPFTIVIPAGQSTVLFPVNIVNDLILEGAETIILTLNNPCSCLKPSETLTILDYLPMIPAPDTITICGPTGVGTVGVVVEGGIEPYTYQWSIGGNDPTLTTFASQSTNYIVTVTDACGRTKTAVARIIVTPAPNAQLLPPAPQLCPGQSVIINVNLTGTGPFEFTYALNGTPQTTISDVPGNPFSITVNQPGLYQFFSLVDAFGCPGSGSGAVPVTLSTLALTGAVSNATCSTLTNGSINTTVSGGAGPYFYTWTGPSNIGNIADPVNILPGSYTVTVTDAFSCNNVQNFIVQSPPPLASSTAVTGVNCFIPNGGTIDLTVAGGNPAYAYLWSNGSTIQDPVGLAAGTYTVTVTDQTGCTKTATASITGNFTAPTSVAAVNDTITCAVSSVPLNGTGSSTGANFTYNWTASPGNILSGNGTLNPIVNQTGNYIILVTNTTNGCTSTATVPVVANNTLPTTEAGPNGTLTCVVNNITLNGNGSSSGSNFLYQWTASNGGSILSGDSTLYPIVTTSGTYTLVVTNTGNGCTSTDNAVVNNNLTLPTAVAAPGGQITCITPSLQLNGTGSSTGPNFTYSWSTSSGGNITLGGNTLMPTVDAVGTYILLVTNTTNGCTSTANTTVSSNANVPTSIAAPQGILTCAVPSVAISGTGSSTGSNFSYQWSTTTGQIISGQGTLQISAGAVGTYTLIVTNTTNNCTATFNTDVTADIAPPIANAGAQVTLSCLQPSSTLDGSNSSTGPNFTYQWSTISGGNFVSATNIQNPQINAPGTYQILVTNTINGCTSTAQVVAIPDATAPVSMIAPPATLNCSVVQTMLNSNGSSTGASYTYSWSGPGLLSNSTNVNALVNAPGNYVLLITNTANGCTASTAVLVPQNIAPPPADAGPDKVLNCFTPQHQLGGPGNPVGANFTFAWTGSGIISGASTANPLVNQSGTFTVVVTNTVNGCTQTDQVSLTPDFINPQVTAGPGFQLTCVDKTYTMQTTGSTGANFSYQWTTNTGTFVGPTNVLTPTVDGAGTYNLLLTNATNGCTSTAQVVITEAADIPLAIITAPAILTCATTALTLNGNGSSSGNEFTYQWTATNGGNIVSGGQTLNPVINQPGIYSLVVSNSLNSCSKTSNVVVLQNIAPPVIDAGATPTITCANTSVSLNGTANPPGTFTYLWTAQNNGNIVSGNNTLNPVVNAVGTYLLSVTNQVNGCSSTDQVNVTIDQVPPVTAILQPATLTCTVQQTPINASGSSNSNMAYNWTTVGGNIVNQSDPLLPIVNQPGTYTLLITSNINGCTSSQTVTVPQDIVLPSALGGNDGLLTCAITSLQLNGSGSTPGMTYAWTTNGGQIISGANTPNPVIGAGGTYLLTVSNAVNGCTASDNVLVNVNTQAPNVLVAPPGLLTCIISQITLNGSGSQPGPNISYTWTTINGNIISGANANSAAVNQSGQYTLTLVNSTNGCSANQSVNVIDNIVLPNAEAGPTFELTCTVEQVKLLGTGSTGSNFSYIWTTAGGNIISGANGLQPLVNNSGTYTLLVTNTLTGCTQSDNVVVTKLTNVPTDLAVDLIKPTCKDNDGVITFELVTGGVGPYLYSINGGINYSATLDFAQIAPGTYDLWIKDVNGCKYRETLQVPKAPDPAISIDPTFKIELGDSMRLQAVLPQGYPLSLVDTVIWTPLDGLTFLSSSIPDLLSPWAKPYKSTEYWVEIVSKDGCEAQDRVLILVDNQPHIYIPNVFSPRKEDGENDVFHIFADNKQILQVDNFQVFDRWGEMLFTDGGFMPNDPAHGWTGRFRGKMMDPAVFVYYAEIRLIDGRVLLFKGDVTLVQ